MAFGAGRHLCLGAGWPGSKLAAFLREITARVDAIELCGDPQYNASNFTWGLRHLPVRYSYHH